MSLGRPDPGDCPICGAPHCSCGGGPIEVVQLPMRDAAAAAQREAAAQQAGPVQGSTAATSPPPLGDGSDDRPFSTATYRGKKKQRR